ncbi:MAG: hypothetical protein ABI317_08780 [Gaiellales bacterium]
MSDVLRAAASLFLLLTGVTLAYALIRAGRALDRISAAVDRTVDEALPLLGKAGEALDQVSGQLANAERFMDGVERPFTAAAGAVSSVDRAVRRVVRRPRD